MWIVCLTDDSHEMKSLIFSENLSKKIKMSPAVVVIGAFRVNRSFLIGLEKLVMDSRWIKAVFIHEQWRCQASLLICAMRSGFFCSCTRYMEWRSAKYLTRLVEVQTAVDIRCSHTGFICMFFYRHVSLIYVSNWFYCVSVSRMYQVK